MDDYAAAVYSGSNLFGLSDGFQKTSIPHSMNDASII